LPAARPGPNEEADMDRILAFTALLIVLQVVLMNR
jgi:hypothetical protein